MEQSNNTTNSRKNKHLNAYERGQIPLLLEDGYTAYAIAQRLNRAYNTICNEIKHGTHYCTSLMRYRFGFYRTYER